MDEYGSNTRIALLILVIMCIGGILLGAYELAFNEDYTKLKEARQTYTAYLDGEGVDLDKIDVHLYRHTYDDEKKVVYLAHKADDNGAASYAVGVGIGTMLGK